jgi:2-(1,2-epoxy-1,2-dihydrophenyl)acetyl-CoA isomerase
MYEKISYELAEGIATITLDRADKLNAYTPEMGEEIVDAFSRARDDDLARVVILTGRGRAFCAGVDLDYMKEHMAGREGGPGPALGQESFVREFPLELLSYAKPVIAAINGDAFGVGVTMTLGCDVRLAADGARLGLNFTGLGMLPGLGSTHLLPQLVGTPKALEWVLSGAVITSDEAGAAGLVQRVVAPDRLADEARTLAGSMAEKRPEVLAAAKRALRQGPASSMAEAMARERELSTELASRRK